MFSAAPCYLMYGYHLPTNSTFEGPKMLSTDITFRRFFFTKQKTAKNEEKGKQKWWKMMLKYTMFPVFLIQTQLVTDWFLGAELISDIKITFWNVPLTLTTIFLWYSWYIPWFLVKLCNYCTIWVPYIQKSATSSTISQKKRR